MWHRLKEWWYGPADTKDRLTRLLETHSAKEVRLILNEIRVDLKSQIDVLMDSAIANEDLINRLTDVSDKYEARVYLNLIVRQAKTIVLNTFKSDLQPKIPKKW